MSNSSPDSLSSQTKPRSCSWPFGFFLSVLLPLAAALLIYQLDSFDPAALPNHELSDLSQHPVSAPRCNSRMLQGSELLGQGKLLGPEDIAYDPESRIIYTGCADGWIKRVMVNESSAADSVVENWVYTGGRPLGVALGHDHNLIVADADKGLLNITEEGVVKLLTNEADGLKFKLTDGVDVADDGMIYFTDASHKYSLSESIWDLLEGRPYGRLMSFDPLTKKTKVLVSDLYFANGVAVSPDQNYVLFSETPVRRCRKYYVRGERKGTVEKFIDPLPGMPDNIRYDGEGHYWIGLSSGITFSWDVALKYPFVRKVLAVMERYIGRPNMEKNGGVFAVDLEGNPTAHYYDPALSMISTGIKIGNHLYCGSLIYPHIIRLDLTQYPAHANI